MTDRLLFSASCDEPNGIIERFVYNAPLTPENLQKIYDKAIKFKHLMGWELKSFTHFVAYFVEPQPDQTFQSRGILARIDDFVGIFWLSDINFDSNSASIHYTFFDRRHKGRLDLCREAIKYVFNTYGFDYLQTMVPLYMHQPHREENGNTKSKLSVFDFVEKIGFTKIKRVKDVVNYRGQRYDANTYIITRKEVLEDNIFSNDNKENTEWAQKTVVTTADKSIQL